MKKSSIVIRLLMTAGVLSALAAAPVSTAHAEENVSHIADSPASKLAITAESLEAYTLVSLKRVYFRFEASDLSPEEKVGLNGQLSSLRGTQSVIELRGYTDGIESARIGTALGATRSQAIARYLVAKGISPERILVVPINAMNDDQRSANPEHRRVDVRVFARPDSGEHVTDSALNKSRQSTVSKPAKGA